MHAFYVTDPDGHTVELGVDTPAENWAETLNPYIADKPYLLTRIQDY